ncbi:unnamed protein product [Alopecurus aequalis]
MEATAVSIGKSVLNGALAYAKSAVAEEVALQFGVQRDKSFITGELEMMQSFLMVAHEEQDEHNLVVRTWVKQVRDIAYDVEDSLQDFVLRVYGRSWWCIPCTFLDRRHVADQMKELRAKVEDVSQRNLRYRLIDGTSKPAKDSGHSTNVVAAMFGVNEARRDAANQHQSRSRLNLAQLISKEAEGLGVIGVWGTSGTVGHTSIIWEAYENPNVQLNFPCRAWVRVTNPFHPKEFIQSIVKQFQAAVGVGILLDEERTGQALAEEFNGYINGNRYLLVLTGLSTIEEWQQISTCFPLTKNKSRIIISTEQVEVASLCSGQASLVSELKQLSAHQTIYAFYQQGSQDETYSTKAPVSISNSTATITNSTSLPITEIQDNQSNDVDIARMVKEKLPHTSTISGVLEEFQLVGREKEKIDIMELILKEATQQFEVIAVWGMGGLGKTTLVKDVYQRQELSDMFPRRAFVTVLRPFKLEEALRSLAMQLHNAHIKRGVMDFAGDQEKDLAAMTIEELIKSLDRLSAENKCLIVLDDLSSTMEWDLLMQRFVEMKKASWKIVIATRQENIAKHCCKKPEYIRLLSGLEDKDAYDLFTKKVFKKSTDLAKQYPELVEPTKLILKKCSGLPLAIVTIGGFLADQPSKSAVEWRKLNEHISAELEMNPILEPIKTVLMKSYDGLPYYLKACFLYLAIFPEDCKISLRRLVRRWIAEGYSREVRNKSAIEIAERYFMELIERSMILPTQKSVYSRNIVDSCQLHDLIRDISISKSMEENLVFRLEGGCSSNTYGAIRHLAISSNWDGDESEFQSIVELSRIRSLTVFGKWRPFYISAEMRFLRVIDFENTKGLANHDLEHIGKLLHLRYLSLRGCVSISSLPDSVGNLSQLETLDIRYTRIVILPKTVIKLSKLHYVHAGCGEGCSEELNCCRKCLKLLLTPFYLCEPFQRTNMRCRDACAYACCILPPKIIRGLDLGGVMVPRGTKRLKALHTLRHVHLAWGNAVINEIKGLTGPRKLGVVGINKKNGPGFCSAISSLSRLESLSVLSVGGLNLDGMSTAPGNLQSLKLSGTLGKLPEWIKGLQNLVKLRLLWTSLSCDGAAMQTLGTLPNLSILGLRESESELKSDVLQFQSGLFRRLTVLDLSYMWTEIKLVEFEEESAPNLEVLNVFLYETETVFSGLEFLQSIKEVWFRGTFSKYSDEVPESMSYEEREKVEKLAKDKVRKDLQNQLDMKKNRVILKVE